MSFHCKISCISRPNDFFFFLRQISRIYSVKLAAKPVTRIFHICSYVELKQRFTLKEAGEEWNLSADKLNCFLLRHENEYRKLTEGEVQENW